MLVFPKKKGLETNGQGAYSVLSGKFSLAQITKSCYSKTTIAFSNRHQQEGGVKTVQALRSPQIHFRCDHGGTKHKKNQPPRGGARKSLL